MDNKKYRKYKLYQNVNSSYFIRYGRRYNLNQFMSVRALGAIPDKSCDFDAYLTTSNYGGVVVKLIDDENIFVRDEY